MNTYLTDANGRRLYDLHGHPMVNHDLYNLRNYLADQLQQRQAPLSLTASARPSATSTRSFQQPRPSGIADAFREWGQMQGFGFCADEGASDGRCE